MRKATLFLSGFLCLGLAALAPPPQAMASAEADETPKPIHLSFEEFKLENGLRVILAEDHSAPTYSISLTYNVGSRDERPGRTGFAHLFEHMMFQGSENVGKGEHFILVFNNGGGMNGTTNSDRTNYFETLPANQLDLGLYLEADRMRSLVINQANLDNQRKAVQEERRLGIDNQAYGKTFETVLGTAYDNFAYKHSTIGSMEDLDAATVEDVAQFFKIYYAPNNAVLALVGDFNTQDALAKIEKYFGKIPAQAPPPKPDLTEPEQKGERRKTLEDNFARLPRVDIIHKTPPSNTPDWYALDVLADVLAGGESSRLYQTLVKEEQAAVNVFGAALTRPGPSLLWLLALARPGTEMEEIERLVYEEIARVQNEPVEDWEMEKVRMQLRRQRAQLLQSTSSRARFLGEFAAYFDDPELINTLEEKYQQVSKADIQRVARRYLKQANRTVITTVPKPAEAAGVGPGERDEEGGEER